MSDAEQSSLRTPQQRSPAYPYIALDAAVERAEKIYRQVHDSAQPREVIAQAYGNPTSSATIQTLATLSQYGLLENVVEGGTRKMRVTRLARELLHPHAPEETVAEAKRQAALSPNIFSEIWQRYGDSKKYGEGVLLYYLTHDREREQGSAFTEKAAKEVLRVYRATMDYAGLTDADKMPLENLDAVAPSVDKPSSEERTDDGANQKQRQQHQPPLGQSDQRSIKMAIGERELQTGILSKGASYRVIVTGKIGVREIERLIAKLELDKEILADDDHGIDELDDDAIKGDFP